MELVVRHGERQAEVRVERRDEGYEVTLDGTTYAIDTSAVGASPLRTHGSLVIAGRQHEVFVLGGGSDGRYRVHLSGGVEEVEVKDPLTHLAESSRGGSQAAGHRTIQAYMPGRVVKILAREGEEVPQGTGLVVLEAMKMENEIRAEQDGRVVKVHVEEGQAVEGGDPLFDIETT